MLIPLAQIFVEQKRCFSHKATKGDIMAEIIETIYQTELGCVYHGKCEDFFLYYKNIEKNLANLILTSPPFPLNRAKKYGNMTGSEYLEWIRSLAPLFASVLAENGSVIIEIGNAWMPNVPEQSMLPMEALIAFKESGKFHLCQEFIHFNPARLPAPVEWVNKKRIRVKDSFTRIWWLSKTPFPKANNKNVLDSYSKQMKKLLKSGKYNAGLRPSEYIIGRDSFNINNGGAIPANVLIASNTISKDDYLTYCKNNNLEIHPARMPKDIPEFFIRFLTEEGDLVIDPFAGSNTTGCVAESLNRRWLAVEAERKYIDGSIGRFSNAVLRE